MKFTYFLFSLTFCFQYKDLLKKNMNQIADELTNGSLLEGRLSINDVENLFSELINSTQIVHQEKIGSTYQGRDILSYSLCYNFTYEKPKILITSLHHSREVASLQMNIYLFLHIIQEVLQQKNPFYINFIYQNCITIIPFVNLDGYAEIEKEFPSNSMPLTRKNLNRTKQCQPHQNGGVDLNRNYGYYFAYNNEGSSNDPCDECYRGEFAFSEKETQAIKYVVENFNIKMAMNLHCFGNLWVVPYSYSDETLDETSIPKLIYDDFKKNGEFKGHYKIGNAYQLVGYTANGEAADWMLSKGVIAISPELGEQVYSNFFNNFYPDKNNTLKLFQTELQPLLHFIRYLPFQPNIEALSQLSLSKIKIINKNLNNSHYVLQVICRNQGVGSGNQNNIIISDSIKVLQVYHSIYSFEHEFDNENIDIKNLLTTEIIGNTIPAINFPARSSIIYYIILQQQNDTQNELKIYFDLFQGEINATTYTLVEQFNDEKESENMYQHLYQLLYVGVAISIVLIILHTLDKKHNKKEQNITELIEQKPENVELKIQL